MKTFILLCIFTAAVANQDVCPENEHFKQCGTACPSTCQNYDDFPRPCVPMCVAGCFCNEGLVRNENNICVTPQSCPSRCPENEHFEQCGTSCPSTCDNFNDSERICVMMCFRGCFCNQGLVRNENNLCVTPEDCPSACQQPKQSGPCTATIHRFYFNNETRQCEEFIYGGCYGNRNRFLTKTECEAECID
ncbi:Kunitz/BPTI-like toxin, partial [Stegodyphus mimosarum]